MPLHRRRIYALARYLYVRGGELAALEWDAVHFDLGYVLIQQPLNTDTGKVNSTKTKRIRKVPIEATLEPLLRAMHEETNGEGTVVEMPSFSEWASGLRRHLQIAGVTWADLFAEDDTRRQLSFRDLRQPESPGAPPVAKDPKKSSAGPATPRRRRRTPTSTEMGE